MLRSVMVAEWCRCRVTPEGFAHMTALLANVAPLAVLLEGGYNLTSTALGTEASLRVLLGERPPPLPNAGVVNSFAAAAIQKTARKQACSSESCSLVTGSLSHHVSSLQKHPVPLSRVAGNSLAGTLAAAPCLVTIRSCQNSPPPQATRSPLQQK